MPKVPNNITMIISSEAIPIVNLWVWNFLIDLEILIEAQRASRLPITYIKLTVEDLKYVWRYDEVAYTGMA